MRRALLRPSSLLFEAARRVEEDHVFDGMLTVALLAAVLPEAALASAPETDTKREETKEQSKNRG